MNNFFKSGEYYRLKSSPGFYNQSIGFVKCEKKYYLPNTIITVSVDDQIPLLFLSTSFLKPKHSSHSWEAEKFHVFLYEKQTICFPIFKNPKDFMLKIFV